MTTSDSPTPGLSRLPRPVFFHALVAVAVGALAARHWERWWLLPVVAPVWFVALRRVIAPIAGPVARGVAFAIGWILLWAMYCTVVPWFCWLRWTSWGRARRGGWAPGSGEVPAARFLRQF